MNEILSRRRWLQIGSLGMTGLSLPVALAAGRSDSRRARAKACLLIYLDGGPSHIDLFDRKPDAPLEVRGPFSSIATSVDGTSVCEHLPNLARQMHHLVQVRSVRHEELVHDPAVYQTLTGYKHLSTAGGLKVEETDLPQMGCAFGRADAARVVLPRVVQIPQTMTMEKRILPGQNAGVLGPAWDAFPVEVTHAGETIAPSFDRPVDVSLERVSRRSSLLRQFDSHLSQLAETASTTQLDAYQQQALDIVSAPSIQTAFDVTLESPATHAAYGRHRHGQSVLLARRLLEAGSRFVTVYWGNEDQDWADGRGPRPANNPWDTHRNHFPLVRDSLLPRADQTFAALLSDMAERGLLDETLVVWMGEFGRTPKISRPWASRDHWPYAYTILMAGAGLPGGKVFGRTDRLAAFVEDDPVSPADVTATIFDTLGVSPSTLLSTADGRPHRLSEGRVVRELWGSL